MIDAALAADERPRVSRAMPGAPRPSEPMVEPAMSEEDEAAIERLQRLGFGRREAAEAYVACGKDENAAANFLFDQ
jgi:uncharacterized UBP type Zn finger protein